jgi:hypothetical protein
VLRLSPDRLLIGLAPDALSLVRVSGAPKARVSEKRTVACDPAFGAEPWQGVSAALTRLAGEVANARARVTVVLSNHFTRYVMVPWSESLRKTEEETAFVRYCFAKIHGERSKEWELRLSPARSGSARIASAVDASLVQAVRAAFPSRAKLASIQPYLMSAFNRWRRQLAGARAWLVLIEPERACLARLERGQWAAVRNSRGSFQGPEQWASLLDRELHLAGGDPTIEDVYVHAPNGWKAPSEKAEGWTFKNLALEPAEGLTPADAERFGMALSVL